MVGVYRMTFMAF